MSTQLNHDESSQFNILKNPYVDNFTSISGSDIVGVFGHVEFINLQGVNVSVNREVQPIYVMGRTDPLSFVRGKRGVAGSLIALATDRGALYDIIERWGVYAKPRGDDTVPAKSRESVADRMEDDVLQESEHLRFELGVPDYADQLPPFDVTLVGRSDALTATLSRIGGVFIVSMGTGISVDDNSIEQQMTFVSLFYEDWRPAGRKNYEDYQQRSQQTINYNPFSADTQGSSNGGDQPAGEIDADFSAETGRDNLGTGFGLNRFESDSSEGDTTADGELGDRFDDN